MSTDTNYLDQFGGAIETYEEASERMAAEAASKGGSKLKMFKIPEGESKLRLIVLHPESPVKGFTYPAAQFFMPINVPGQTKPRYVKVLRATDNGFDKDLILEFKKLANAAVEAQIATAKGARKKELEALKDNLNKGSYNNDDSLLYDFKQVAYALDLESSKTRKEGWQVVEFSNKQATDLKLVIKKLWDKRAKKELAWADDNDKDPRQANMVCPATHPGGAFVTEIDKGKVNNKTEYRFSIDNDVDNIIELTEAEIKSFFDGEPLHKAYKGYNRYHYGATIAFLDQFDARLNLGVFSSDEFQDIVKAFEAQLDPADTQEFSLESKSSDDSSTEGEEAVDGLLLDDLLDEFDELSEFDEDSEEIEDFRKKLRLYIAQEGLKVKIGRRKSTEDAVQEIEEAIDEKGGERGVTDRDGGESTEADTSGGAPEPEAETEAETEEEDKPRASRSRRTGSSRAGRTSRASRS